MEKRDEEMNKSEGVIYNNKYCKLKTIGKGSFGKVVKAQEIENATKFYAVKIFYIDNIKRDKVNFVDRQITVLNVVSHRNIIKYVDRFFHKENECIVFDYYQYDLLHFVKLKNFHFEESLLRQIMKQILSGLSHLHKSGVIHRDLKPDNILISNEGVVAIADFDLARFLSKQEAMSRSVVTLYFRAPEIFYGETHYDYSVDMWSVGCVLAELILKEPLFKGRSELDVLFKTYEVLSSANEENWPGCTQLPNFFSYGDNQPSRPLKSLFSGLVSEDCIDLISKLVVLDPKKRLSAQEALNHKFFSHFEDETEEEIIKKFLFE